MEKSIKSNVVFDSMYKILNILFPLITSMYIARVLLPSEIGKISYAQNIVSYFTVTASLGIPTYGIREIAKVRRINEEKNKVFSELFFINLISTLVCSIIYYFIILRYQSVLDIKLFLICGTLIILNIFNVDWLYQGEEEYRYIALRSFGIKVVSLILVILLVRQQQDYLIYAVIYCCALGGNYLLNIVNCKKYVKIKLNGISLSRHIKSIMIMFATVISVEIYTQLDTTMIGIWCDNEAIAYYTYAIKSIRLISTLFTSFAAVLLPRLSYYYATGLDGEFNRLINKVFRILTFLCIPACIGTYCISDNMIIILYGSNFLQAATTVKVLSILIFVLAVGNLFGTQVLVTVGREKQLLYSTICGAILNVVLNSILIPTYAEKGAAIASVISEVVVLLYQYIEARKYITLYKNIRDYISIFVGSILLILIEIIIKQYVDNIYLNILVSIILGGVVYFISFFLQRNTILDEILEMLHIKK